MAEYWITNVEGTGGYAEKFSLKEALEVAAHESIGDKPLMVRDEAQKPLYLAIQGMLYRLGFVPIVGNEYRLKKHQYIYASPDYQTQVSAGSLVRIMACDEDSITASFRLFDGQIFMLYLTPDDLYED
jgi:hypothetical protein